MTTNVARLALQAETPSAAAPASRESLAQRVVTRLAQWLCGIQGHDALLHFEPNRVTLRCAACGHTSPGWTTEPRAPVLRFEGDAARHRLPGRKEVQGSRFEVRGSR
ncbi:MAG: hypothetical protein GEV06_04950 [Luteitalea sp.]|nr:hypothetical protein [Luteitalea sp.]